LLRITKLVEARAKSASIQAHRLRPVLIITGHLKVAPQDGTRSPRRSILIIAEQRLMPFVVSNHTQLASQAREQVNLVGKPRDGGICRDRNIRHDGLITHQRRVSTRRRHPEISDRRVLRSINREGDWEIAQPRRHHHHIHLSEVLRDQLIRHPHDPVEAISPLGAQIIGRERHGTATEAVHLRRQIEIEIRLGSGRIVILIEVLQDQIENIARLRSPAGSLRVLARLLDELRGSKRHVIGPLPEPPASRRWYDVAL